MIITRHHAIAQALKLQQSSTDKISLVDLVQKIYKKNQELDLDHLCFMLHFLGKNLDNELEDPISFYILCLRLGTLESA
jgi:hypothetical protein